MAPILTATSCLPKTGSERITWISAILFTHSVQHLAEHGIYVIEDVSPSDLLRYKGFFGSTGYVVEYITMLRPNLPLGDNSLIIIRKG